MLTASALQAFFFLGGSVEVGWDRFFWAAALYDMVVRGGVREDGGWANC